MTSDTGEMEPVSHRKREIYVFVLDSVPSCWAAVCTQQRKYRLVADGVIQGRRHKHSNAYYLDKSTRDPHRVSRGKWGNQGRVTRGARTLNDTGGQEPRQAFEILSTS